FAPAPDPQRGELQIRRASVPMPKFASACRKLRTNFGVEKDARKPTLLARLLNLKFAPAPDPQRGELQIRRASRFSPPAARLGKPRTKIADSAWRPLTMTAR